MLSFRISGPTYSGNPNLPVFIIDAEGLIDLGSSFLQITYF
jgi:hypothetical protein